MWSVLNGQLCFSTANTYPKVLGAEGGDTLFQALEISTVTGDIAFGGYT